VHVLHGEVFTDLLSVELDVAGVVLRSAERQRRSRRVFVIEDASSLKGQRERRRGGGVRKEQNDDNGGSGVLVPASAHTPGEGRGVSVTNVRGCAGVGEEDEVPRGTSSRDARDGYFGETVTCMNSPCAEMLLTRMVVPVAGRGTLAQPKLPMAGFGATQ